MDGFEPEKPSSNVINQSLLRVRSKQVYVESECDNVTITQMRKIIEANVDLTKRTSELTKQNSELTT